MHEKLPDDRAGLTRKFTLHFVHKNGTPDKLKLYFTAGMYADGRLGEVFVKADKTGSLASGMLEGVAIMISLGLQSGVPLQLIVEKLRHTKFNPSGFTGDKEFPSCTSPLDLLAQWLGARWLPKEGADTPPVNPPATKAATP